MLAKSGPNPPADPSREDLRKLRSLGSESITGAHWAAVVWPSGVMVKNSGVYSEGTLKMHLLKPLWYTFLRSRYYSFFFNLGT